MTFEEYINNPTQSRAFVNMREMNRITYTAKFNIMMVKENGKFDYHLYTLKDKFFIYIKIPSETVPDFYYDVVIEFFPSKKGFDEFRTLDKYQVRFFSNDPSFVYTFAYAFNKNNMFISELSAKMGKIPLSTKPKETNPKLEIGHVKSLYIAYLYIKNAGLLHKGRFKAEATKLDYKQLMSNIMNADEKIEARQTASSTPKKEVSAPKKQSNSIIGKIKDTVVNNNVRQTKKVSQVKTTRITKTTKTNKNMKRK